jgi:hypothetical protein
MIRNVIPFSRRGLSGQMTPGRVVNLVCPGSRPTVDWENLASEEETILIASSADEIDLALAEAHWAGCEVRRIVFDGSIGTAAFMRFLARLSHQFRGDALLICFDGNFLSVIGGNDSRGIHLMGPGDLQFYIQTVFRSSVLGDAGSLSDSAL